MHAMQTALAESNAKMEVLQNYEAAEEESGTVKAGERDEETCLPVNLLFRCHQQPHHKHPKPHSFSTKCRFLTVEAASPMLPFPLLSSTPSTKSTPNDFLFLMFYSKNIEHDTKI